MAAVSLFWHTNMAAVTSLWKRSITSHVVWSLVWNVIRHFAPPPTGGKARETLLPTAECSEDQDNISDYAIVVWEPAVN